MTKSWSEKLAAHYGLRLPEDLRAWLDDEVWRLAGGAEFSQPQSPDQLIDPDGSIWGGFMLPDTLPIVGNDYGDWLCLRVGFDGTISEVLHWSHGGGDWIPYGRSLSEALVYDAASRILYNRKPEFTAPEPPPEEVFRLAQWALSYASNGRAAVQPFWRQPTRGDEILKQLVGAKVAETVARRDLCLAALNTRLRREGSPRLAASLGIAWEPDFVSWQFDGGLVPEDESAKLVEHFHEPIEQLTAQDWNVAEREALSVARKRQDLGWALETAGWAAERRGDFDAAIGLYDLGIHAPIFSDDAVRFRSQWFPPGYGKFSAFRLGALKDRLPANVAAREYLQLFLVNDADTLKARVRDYWFDQAEAAEQCGALAEAYRALYQAGWDCGLPTLEEYGPLLERLQAIALQMKSPSLAQLAKAHRQSLLS
jgi:hypothetical protein